MFLASNSNSDSITNDQRDLKFYIFGHNISHSLSPALHNAGFKEIGLRGHYSIYESPNIDASVERLIDEPEFGGASVTFPHKLQVGRLLDHITPAAYAVGAINTIIVENNGDGKRILVGDNTDWSGIRTCVLHARKDGLERSPALVWGAGGAARAACYAIQSLGIREVFILNRSRESAERMAKDFPELKFSICSTMQEFLDKSIRGPPVRVVVSCIPADHLDESQILDALFAAPSGVLIEMAYRPPVTATMKVVSRHPQWTVFNGMDVLVEQGFLQFKKWTGRDAPTEVMKTAMEQEITKRERISSHV
ncbi:hypothetical protein F4679DRAFT_535323 [Xylaria curta]|nr:hypothetical protein F4679DRAFT_535323 [Xylaria curta]